MEICNKENCTGCGACAYACSKQAITMQENKIGIIYPVIDETKCIECGRCKKVCPQVNPPQFRVPLRAYAAWSSNEEERRTSASGGVAAEIYHYALEQGYMISGAVCNSDFSVSHRMGNSENIIADFKNSKYVFSTVYELYHELKRVLKDGRKAVVIGLPCQIAAIKKLFPEDNKLLLIDVVCHGITPYTYLKQHINMLEKRNDDKAVKMSFRDPDTFTYTYTFTLYNKQGNRFYAQRTKDGDTYQFGYHRMVSYRENCYHCQYAQSSRISDLTLSDYKGLGKMKPCSYTEQKVSCILVHTDKGAKCIESLIKSKRIRAEERPVLEPIEGDGQLQHPSEKSKARIDFQRYIQIFEGDFEKTMKRVLRHEAIRVRIRKIRYVFGKIKRKVVGG